MSAAMKISVTMAGVLLALAFSASTVRAQNALADVDPSIAPQPVPEIVAPDAVLKMMQEKDPGIALVDTQPVDGYAEGHIPGAVNYPWVMRVKVFPISLPRNKTLIMYGSCPHDTEDLIRQLAEYGYTNIKVMDGGWYKWVALKYPAAGAAVVAAAGKNENAASQPAVVDLAGAPGKADKPATR